MSDKPTLIKGLNAEYTPATWNGKDTSGIRCVGTTLVVLMDECAPKTTGGIELPADMIEKFTMASESGIIVKVSDGAFLLNEDCTPWSGDRPGPGDRVFCERYAGKQIKGRDGLTYRLMDYKAIGAIYEAPEAEKASKAA